MMSNEPKTSHETRSFNARETPLINRVEEMELLKKASDAATEGVGSVFLLYGEAGIGKTRLTNELRDYARSRGMKILYGRCPVLFRMDGVPPYVLWKEVIRDYLRSCTPEQLQSAVGYYPGEIYKLVPEIKQKLATFPESQPLNPEMERDRFFEAVSQFFENISKNAPLMVVLDDLQWCDQSSLLLLHYLARGVYRNSLLLIGAYRDVEVEDKHPLFPVLTDLKRSQLLQSAKLKRFNLDEVSEMIRQILLQDEVPGEFCKLVFEKTGGNPFFVEEVLQSLKEEGVIYPYGVEYRFKEVSKIEFPETVRSILQARIGRLDDETQQVLRMASFIGKDFTFEDLCSVTGMEESRLLEIIERMTEKNLFKCRVTYGEDVCSFSDVLVKDVLYESVGPLKRRKLHGIVGCALEKAYFKDMDEHLGELAAHFLESGNEDKALDYFLRAGEKAARVYANSEAASYYDSALRLLEAKGDGLQERAQVLEVLGDVKSLVGEFDACLKRWNEALLLYKQIGEREKVARLHRKSSSVLMHKMGDPEKAKEHQLKALEILEAEPESAELASLRTETAHLYWHIGEMATALPLAEKAVETANKLNDCEAIANSYIVLGKLLAFQGDRKKATEIYGKALKIALEKGYTEIVLEAMSAASGHGSPEGNEVRLQRLQEQYEMAKKVGAISVQSWAGDGLASMYVGMGNADKALILSEESVALDRKTGNLHNLPRSLGTLGNAYRMLGEWEKAEKCYKEALSISEKQNIATSIAGSYLSLGSLNLAKENFGEAREFFEKSSELFKKSGVRFVEAGLLTPAIWASIELGELEKAENRISVMQMIAQKLDNKQLFSFATVSRAMLLRAQKNWNESIEYFEKSFHEFEALNAKRWHAEFYARRFLCEYARVYLERGQEGDRDKARRLLNQALEIFQKINAGKEIEKTKAILLNIEKGLPAVWEQKRVDLVVTGHTILDKLLYGGLHPGFSAVLTSPSCSERDSLVRSFVETGAKKGEPTFYATANPDLTGLAQEYPSNLYLFICNPQAESIAKKFSNVFTLNGVENLTNINIALTKAIRKLDPASKIPRRICIDLVSDILLQHGLIMTRKWLTELITQLKTAGFTILAAIDSQMHPLEQLYAVLGLFDGEVNIREVETEEGLVRILRIKKMGNQKYSKDEVRLTVE